MGKLRVDEPLFLSTVGLEGDECAETRFHGGEERALHQYPAEHYLYWQTQFGAQRWQAPGMGENISTQGMLETTVCIGDVYQWGRQSFRSASHAPLATNWTNVGRWKDLRSECKTARVVVGYTGF